MIRVVQPRTAGFWVLVAGLAAGAYQLYRWYTRSGVTAYAAGLATGLVLAAVYCGLWLIVLNSHNRYLRLPGRALAIAFVWGAVATAAMASRANGAGLSLWTKAFGTEWARDWAAGLTAPFTEEIAKATALLLVMALAPRLVRGPHDGLIVGAYAGLGMQISEDVMYALLGTARHLGIGQAGAAASVIELRAVAGLFQHVMLSAIFCSGLMWVLGNGKSRRRTRGLLMMLGAVALHGGWDNSAALGHWLFGPVGGYASWLVGAVLAVAGSVLLIRTFRWAVPVEQARIRDILAPEVESGLLTPAEAAAAAGSNRERRAFREAGGDLRVTWPALRLARSQGADTEDAARARAAIQRLRTVVTPPA